MNSWLDRGGQAPAARQPRVKRWWNEELPARSHAVLNAMLMENWFGARWFAQLPVEERPLFRYQYNLLSRRLLPPEHHRDGVLLDFPISTTLIVSSPYQMASSPGIT